MGEVKYSSEDFIPDPVDPNQRFHNSRLWRAMLCPKFFWVLQVWYTGNRGKVTLVHGMTSKMRWIHRHGTHFWVDNGWSVWPECCRSVQMAVASFSSFGRMRYHSARYKTRNTFCFVVCWSTICFIYVWWGAVRVVVFTTIYRRRYRMR